MYEELPIGRNTIKAKKNFTIKYNFDRLIKQFKAIPIALKFLQMIYIDLI